MGVEGLGVGGVGGIVCVGGCCRCGKRLVMWV